MNIYPATQVTILPNLLRVASYYIPHIQSATVGVWLGVGSRYESANSNGVAHFLEHMSFKGTPRRDRIRLESEIENAGMMLNAYTSRDMTVFYAKIMKNELRHALDILSDILLKSTYNNIDIDNERSVIIREMEEIGKDSEEVLFDYLHECAFGKESCLGRTILGTTDIVNKIDRNDLIGYIKKHYTTNRMVITGVGSFDHKELVDYSQELFSSVPHGPPSEW